MTSNNNKLKILAFHGYRQSDKVFSAKLGSLRKSFKRDVEFVFLKAPHYVPPPEDEEKKEDTEGVDEANLQRFEELGWWFNTESRYFKAIEPSNLSVGFEESLQVVQKAFNEQGPIDGILGFSQGASFVSILCNMHQKKIIPIEFNFAVMISGFKSLCKPHEIYYEEKLALPTLHVYGEGDKIIPTKMCGELADVFTDKEIFLHEGGHYVPGKKHIYDNFFKKMLEKKMSEYKND